MYLARSVTGRLRALKVVRREDFEYEKTFEREFEGIQHYEQVSQDHPGLVDVLHVGRDDENGFYYYVMELADDVSGGQDSFEPETYEARTLSSELRNRTVWTIEETVNLGITLAGALGHLHLAGLTHRDVKPSNIIFVKGVPKLADVGLVAQTGQRTYVGTEGYVPPEGPGTSSADLYSLAMVLYQVHTGKDRLEFPELPTNLEIPPTVNRDEWRALNGVICRAGSPDPAKRFDSAHSLALALRQVIDSNLPTRKGREKRSLAGAMIWIVLLLLLAGAGAGGYWLWKDNQAFLKDYATLFASNDNPGDPGTKAPRPIEEVVVEDPVTTPDSNPSEESSTPGTPETPGEGKPGTDTPPESPGEKGKEKGGDVTKGKESHTPETPGEGEGKGKEPETQAKEKEATAPDTPKEEKPLVANVVQGELKVMSEPSGATVWIDGEEIGRTETKPIELPVGPLEIVLKHPDFRDTVHRMRIREGFQLANIRLVPDRGPIAGNPWINGIGVEFLQNENGAYISRRPISMQAFNLFLSETDAQIPVTGFSLDGEKVALVRDEAALFQFCDWMTQKDRERGFLGREQYHRPVRIASSNPQDTFHSMLDEEFGTLLLNSSPEGAEVTVNGEFRGVTPLVLNDVRTGPFRAVFSFPGFETRVETGEGPLTAQEPVALVAQLERDSSIVFGEPSRNSLGMDLVPVGRLMVAVHETRVSDFRAYVSDARSDFVPTVASSQALNHPVTGVTRHEASDFCEWLTGRERELGLIQLWQRYRLPTDEEWSSFVGEQVSPGTSPGQRSRNGDGSFPWGTTWPPTEGAGNFADLAARPEFGDYVIAGYNDGFATTSPVGSFQVSARGLADLSGNVWEWVGDLYDASSGLGIVRGGGWDSHDRDMLRKSFRNPVPTDTRQRSFGFRFVLEDTRAAP